MIIVSRKGKWKAGESKGMSNLLSKLFNDTSLPVLAADSTCLGYTIAPIKEAERVRLLL